MNYIMHTLLGGDTNGYRSLYESLRKDISRHKESLEKLEKCLALVDQLKFKPGSVVVHKTFGNGLVLCPYIKELVENQAFHFDDILEKFETDLGYVVQFVKAEGGMFKYVKEVVKEEDIMPYTGASQILYGE
jgi:hypothetical protein